MQNEKQKGKIVSISMSGVIVSKVQPLRVFESTHDYARARTGDLVGDNVQLIVNDT